MKDWRNHPSTKGQHYHLKRLGLSYSETISRGQASDLISQHQAPTDDQLLMLEFFRAKATAPCSQHEANTLLEKLMSDPANRIRWEERICSSEQREILRFFKLPVRSQLKHRDADRLIEILLRNNTYAKRWDKYETAKFAREDWFEKNLDYVNDTAAYFGCTRLNGETFTAVVHALEAQGMTLQEIENDYAALFQEILSLYPEFQRARRAL